MRRFSFSVVAFVLLATGAWTSGRGAVGEAAVAKGSGATTWPAARFTPIALPKSGACPRSPGGRAAPAVGITLGVGPAFPVLGFDLQSPPPNPGGVINLRLDRPPIGGRYAQKVLWAVAPMAARFTVTGGRLDGATGDRRIGFQSGDSEAVRQYLHVMGSNSANWTYYPTAILVKRSGCYEFQINSTQSASTVVFQTVFH